MNGKESYGLADSANDTCITERRDYLASEGERMREKFGGNNGSVTLFEQLKRTGWLSYYLKSLREGANEFLSLSLCFYEAYGLYGYATARAHGLDPA